MSRPLVSVSSCSPGPAAAEHRSGFHRLRHWIPSSDNGTSISSDGLAPNFVPIQSRAFCRASAPWNVLAKVMLSAKERRQYSLDLLAEASDFDLAWKNASEPEKRSRTIFAQHSLRPEEVIPEWDATRLALGGFGDTERFVTRALTRLARAPQRRPAGPS